MSDQPTAKEIAEAIQQDVLEAERLAGTEIKAEFDGGIARLSGQATSVLDKQLAGNIAKRTRGVEAVVNQIIVKRSDRSDDEVRDDVLKVLVANDSVDKPQIAVDVSDGEVAMIGKVDSLAEKRIAELAASGVRGVVSVDNQLTVALSKNRPDADLRDEISALIVHSVYLDDVDVDIKVNDHIAKLSGTVHSALQKDRLERIAEVWGIESVDVSSVKVESSQNVSMIREKRYADVSDDSINQAVNRCFRVDPVVFSRVDDVAVTAKNGVVTLDGTVDRLRVKNKAEKLAGDVIGVKRVRNHLEVEYGGETPSDIDIVRETQAAMMRSPYLDRRDLRVHCQAAHVSLYGVVESELEKNVAEWIADGMSGVVHVNNTLAVEKEWKQKSDSEIEKALKRKLKFAFYDRSDDLSVNVQGGVAIIRGTVDTWRQWQAVLDLALEAGSRHSHNLVNVRHHPPHEASRIYVFE